MDVITNAAGQVLASCLMPVFRPIKKGCSYIRHCKDNIKKFEIKLGELKDLTSEIEERVKAGQRELKEPVPAVVKWLEDAKEIFKDGERNEKKIKEKDQWCFGLPHWNLMYRYTVSKRAIEKSTIIEEKIKEMKDRGSSAVSLPGRPLMLGSTPTAYSKSLPSRESTLNKIMEALKNKEVHVIGIYGMGGVGKTTLIEEVARRAEADRLFSEVVQVEVSQAPDVLKVQQQIAERISLPLHDSNIADERARKIHVRLGKKTHNEALKKGGSQAVVILDNIWEKLDLDRVGIPRDCKIVLTTRSEDVCRKMGADKIIKVRGLDDTEATKLFLERARHPADHDDAYKSVTSKLVKKCEGLPLAIVALADALRDRDLSIWKDVAAKLGRPVSARVGGAIEEKVYPVLEWSYDFLSSDEKKKFFLLCCLFPLGSSIAIQDLMRYGAGLGLFQHMNSLDQATKQANSWASELKSSSLLLEAEDEQHVKLQDVVRATSMSIASKGDNVFQFGSFPQLLKKDTFKSYTAISMTKGHNHKPLSRFEFPRLEMLLLKGSQPYDKFSDNFFQWMNSLEVLVMSDMKFQTLPSSITQLKNLRTLHLERCDLSDISAISELVDLLFLSLRGSTIDELPREFENLVHLKLLDLTGCSKLRKIHAGVIAGLTELEELYMMGSFENEGRDNEERVANLIELNSLSYLAVLELHVPSIDLLPADLLFSQLSRFQISIGSRALNKFFSSDNLDHFYVQQLKLSSQILLVENIEGNMLRKQSINCLLQKAECLILEKIMGLASITDCLVNDGFRNLKRLYVRNCSDMEYIASTNESNEEGVFPKLEELFVYRMRKLKGIYHGLDLYDSFDHLQILHLEGINFDLSFWDDDDDNVQNGKPFFNKKMKFPSLEYLYISNVRGIVELWHFANVEEEVPAFPKLVKLGLVALPELRSIWRSNDVITHRSFQNLKNLFVIRCPNLEMICPLSVAAALEQLRDLNVWNNKNMKEIITKETGEMKNGDTEITIFPKLQFMSLEALPSLKCFFGCSIKLVFPSLETIKYNDLKEMVAFVIPEYPENSNALFNDKVVMPVLKHIDIYGGIGPQEIWGSHLDARSFNELKTIYINSAEKVMKVFSLDTIKQMQNLKELDLREFQLVEEFIDPVGFYNDEVENLALLPQLKNLVMNSFPRLKRVPWEELALKNLRELKFSKIHGLTSLFPVSVCRRLLNLETLHIIDCEKMEEIVGGRSWDTNIAEVKVEFPRLNFLRLDKLPAFRSLGSNNVILDISSIEGVGFGQFQNQFLLILLQKFQHVKNLKLGGCEALLESFNLKGRAYAIPPRLRKFTLYDMPNLQRIPWTVFSVKSIHYLEISKIYGLKFLFPASMHSEGFVQLEEIHINHCDDLEQVFAQGSIEVTSNNATSTTIVLPRVKIIKLEDLQSLRSFSSQYYNNVELPSLEEVKIEDCSMMETFSYGSLSTPRSCKISMDWKNEEECYDLNAFFTKRREGDEIKSIEGETSGEEGEASGEEGETSREDAKGKSIEWETTRGAKGESVEGENSGEDAKGETSGECAKEESVEGETSEKDAKGESVEREISGADAKKELVEGEASREDAK